MNNQQIVKIINFYRINHQFHQPYRFLLDGNFIKLLVEKDIDLKKKFDQIAKAKCSLRVTSCIIRQLELLGDQFKLVVAAAKQLKIISCKHSLQYTVDHCLMEQIGPNNPKQYIICSQDLELRRQVRNIVNVPIMYFGPDQRITMEDIQKKTLLQLQRQMKDKLLPQQQQLKEVQELKKKEAEMQKKLKIKQLSSQQGIQIKTKIVKGPNPLSVKKKQIKSHAPAKQNNPTEPKRKRIRKRNKKGNTQPAAQ